MIDDAWTAIKFALLIATACYRFYHKWINAKHIVTHHHGQR
ncbi:hypothetical protein EDE05_11796 [Neorhizobium sp. R1-B]|nr:hypothetical protein EDE05_11796 [Neorhizobium sp. R1-B]